VNEEKNPDLFLKEVLKGNINFSTDLESNCEKLIFLIENNDNSNVIVKCLEILCDIIPHVNKQYFNFFQELSISDVDPLVRYTSAKILIINFIEKSLDALKSVLNNEASSNTLSAILKMLKSKAESALRNILDFFYLIRIYKNDFHKKMGLNIELMIF